MSSVLRDIIQRNRAGAAVAIPSVCSAQPDVLRASLGLAQRLGRQVVIEATSNQVNQDGGYTGMTPRGFIDFVHGIADSAAVDRDLIIFGGDHLGPQAWRSHDVGHAMDKAETMLRDYVAAGFGKIHLDCSEGCAGEPAQLGDAQTAMRSAQLARICTEVADDLLFVVGTEVPPPGGARADEEGDIPPTDPAAARATLDAHDQAFGDMAPLIGGLVVQPGVEFSPTAVHHMPLDRDPGLIDSIADRPGVCLEAHSTDYQNPAVFPRLAELGFAFQKVGPALTFAYREALYGLDQLRDPLGGLQSAMEAVMLADPSKWQNHYEGSDAALYQQRHFGLADRIRYYWPTVEAQSAVTDLLSSFSVAIPDAKLQTVFGADLLDRAANGSGDQITRLIDAHISLALEPYFFEDAT
ncbi:class II D-tagatose-bisphosphate aldolase non-catalytic subunit [Loktanella sp. Alg231-35]|uniref:class II D-tagatose-bisphosphate aldolase non-catalytic subunit n=1 Tax=Loktanella sp. Alg231-35 TaxID=1922220 RepID=UPI000D558490|nr:class II D-tagatose-bisphosphate aldolase, non-catalytic subunit [Loktanella sp. Alg231-35]